MADGTITVTIDTGEWVFPDSLGIPHTVTNGQTFTLTSIDTGSGAQYRPVASQAPITTTDGYKITLRPCSNTCGIVTPAGDTAVTNSYNGLGEWIIECSSTGKPERWKCTGLDMNDADAPTEFTAARFECVNDPTRVFTWTTVTASFA